MSGFMGSQDLSNYALKTELGNPYNSLLYNHELVGPCAIAIPVTITGDFSATFDVICNNAGTYGVKLVLSTYFPTEVDTDEPYCYVDIRGNNSTVVKYRNAGSGVTNSSLTAAYSSNAYDTVSVTWYNEDKIDYQINSAAVVSTAKGAAAFDFTVFKLLTVVIPFGSTYYYQSAMIKNFALSGNITIG